MWETLLSGMLLATSIVMLIVGLVHLRKGSIELAIICILIASGNVYGYYPWHQAYFNDSILANILLAEYRVVLVPSLLYIYLLKKTKPLKLKTDSNYFRHLILPLLYIITYIVLKFGFKNFNTYRSIIVPTFWIIYLSIITFYLFLTVRLEKKIRSKIIKRLRKHYHGVIKIFILYLYPITIYLIFKILNFIGFFQIENKQVNHILEIIEFPVQLAITVFVLLELDFLKRYFTVKDIENPEYFIPDEKLIEQAVNELKSEKPFLDPSFNLGKFCNDKLSNQKHFKNFIAREYNQSTVGFLNQLRVEEFKSILNNNHMDYDLFGIAQECGFKSKATFFRVFKEIEGMTPNQYKQSIS